jgi:hypothetical protein
MRKLLVLSCLLLVSSAFAAPPADFSGTWTLNPAKSKNLGMMSSMEYESTITQSGDTLTVRNKTTVMGQTQNQEIRYALNGSEVANTSYMGDPARTATHWDGRKLVTVWTTEGAVAGTTKQRIETRSLSDDSATMLVESANPGRPPIVFAFERKN